MNIEGFSEMTAGQLHDQLNVNNFSDLYTLNREQVGGLEGFKEQKTNNLFASIENSKKVELANFIYALGIDNVGKKTAKDLANRFKSIDNLKNATREQLLESQDIGEIIADCIVDYFKDVQNLAEIDTLLSLGVQPIFEDTVIEGVFSGEKVVLTGTLTNYKRDEAGKIIESLGGEILSSVSKSTTMVLAGENAGSKLDKAKKLGVKIIDEQTFISLINNK
jgi:DNA ligase (NAD+)